MERLTIEEATWELFNERGSEVLDVLDSLERNVVQMAWGIKPYQQNSFLEIARILGIPKSTAYWRYRKALRIIHINFKKHT